MTESEGGNLLIFRLCLSFNLSISFPLSVCKLLHYFRFLKPVQMLYFTDVSITTVEKYTFSSLDSNLFTSVVVIVVNQKVLHC